MTASRSIDLELSVSVKVSVEAIVLWRETMWSNGCHIIVLRSCACASIVFVALVEVAGINVTNL